MRPVINNGTMTIRLPEGLLKSFKEKANAENRDISKVVRDFMRTYVNEGK